MIDTECLPAHWPDAQALTGMLAEHGYARVPALIDADDCANLAALYERPEAFRSRVVMARHGFGRGEYQYFAYPLPETVARLRAACYPVLAQVANHWAQVLGEARRFEPDHAGYLARCHAGGQRRPTPLLLRYGQGDYNCLHQDLYGEWVFPLQLTVLLSRPGIDFDGGEFVLTEQRPRRQSRVSVVPLQQGDAVIFPVSQRPAQGSRGPYRTMMRHGVSEVRRGSRQTLGIIFHDAA